MSRPPFVRVLPALATAAVAAGAAANPPPPKVLPDPPLIAPMKDEAPTVVRKHDGLCFGFYPSGGTLAVVCPPELITEPLGEAILKNPAGRCQFIPFQSGGPGRTGNLDKCPAIFATVAKAGVVPEESLKIMQQAAMSRTADDHTAMDPPIPARLETTPPQQIGCEVGHGTTARGTLALPAAVAAMLAVRARRRHRL